VNSLGLGLGLLRVKVKVTVRVRIKIIVRVRVRVRFRFRVRVRLLKSSEPSTRDASSGLLEFSILHLKQGYRQAHGLRFRVICPTIMACLLYGRSSMLQIIE